MSEVDRNAVPRDAEQLVARVRERYADVARGGSGCCGPSGCGGQATSLPSVGLGYDRKALRVVPAEADLGLGCGAPLTALALRPGETVLDLGSGGGLDALLAAGEVGTTGHVIGVDMTPEMLARARGAAARAGAANVEFREGRLEALPVADASVDAVTSNCVINLVPDKARVFAEIARVLRPGGRVVVSDIVLGRALPPALAADMMAYAGCISGAVLREDYLAMMREAGLHEVEVLKEFDYLSSWPAEEVDRLLAGLGVTRGDAAGAVWSVTVRGKKP